jgi:hypothetical protein
MAIASVLEREMFSEAEAARLLRVPQSTLHYWLDGGEYRRKTYKPVIRLHPRGDRLVTWAEFVEAGLLREYRRTHRVPMAELRTFIDLLREELGVPYPLAHQKPFVSEGRQLVLEAQDASGPEADYCWLPAKGSRRWRGLRPGVSDIHWALAYENSLHAAA